MDNPPIGRLFFLQLIRSNPKADRSPGRYVGKARHSVRAEVARFRQWVADFEDLRQVMEQGGAFPGRPNYGQRWIL
jgi:hypothetical protein